jgi:hypothetical protein
MQKISKENEYHGGSEIDSRLKIRVWLFFVINTRPILIIWRSQTWNAVWAAISRFAGFNVADELDVLKIHRLQDVIDYEGESTFQWPSHMVGSNGALHDLNQMDDW